MPNPFIYGRRHNKFELYPLELTQSTGLGRTAMRFDVSGSEDSARYAAMVTRAAMRHFEMYTPPKPSGTKPTPFPAAFKDQKGCLRVVYKEIVLRFEPKTRVKKKKQLLKKFGFTQRAVNEFDRDQITASHPDNKCFGYDLFDVANALADSDEVRFATPNFVSEYVRDAVPQVKPAQWHLRNLGKNGQTKDEDVSIREAWKISQGDPGIVVAVIDDGVDLSHPNLRYRVLRKPDPNNPKDSVGRDFYLPSTHEEHFNPRPKVFTYPYHVMRGNDIHGTPCAGVIVSDGRVGGILGAAPRCRVLPVKVFHADEMASDAAVANAIRYAARFADVVSCSWSGSASVDIELALEDAGATHDGLGAAIFCASGNDGYADYVSFPAAFDDAIAVGASTDIAGLASYSNRGKEISVVAPSSGGMRGIYTTDVAIDNRGFNIGDTSSGDAAGLFTNDFGGTSSATPLAAAIAALCFSVNPGLDRDAVRSILEQTADKIGGGYVNGHSVQFGYGRLNAAKAIELAESS